MLLRQKRRFAGALSAMMLFGLVAGCTSKGKTNPPPSQLAQPKPGQPSGSNVGSVSTPELPGAIAVMVENSPQARPQTGLEKADLVYELEAEGGITRFMAFFYQNKSAKIGPVRSARMGFYDIATAYATPYAHAGGNYDVLQELKKPNQRLLNLDEIFSCGSCFNRSTDRSAPHNLYTSTDKLVARAGEVKFAISPLAKFPEGAKPAGGKPAPSITLDWGPGTQEVTWTWNGSMFMRYQDGGAHVMESGARLGANNVVVLITRYAWDPHPPGQPDEGQNNITIVGSGSGYLFRDGTVYPIRWQKPSRAEQYTLTTPDGARALLSPGITWMEVVKTKENISQGRAE